MIRQEDGLVRASWSNTLDLIARKLKGCSDDQDSVGILTSAKGTNEENYLFMKLARAGLKTNNIDHVARLCHAPSLVGLTLALGSGAMTNPINSLAKSDTILVAGSNTAEQHTLVFRYIHQARSNGAKLVVVDPRKTHITRQADLHLMPRPGTDIAWINGMLNIIIKEALIDKEFIVARTEGYDEVRQAVSKYTPEKVERITGIPPDALREAAIAYGSADRGSIVYAMGITQHIKGTDNVLALANLALATGNLGREGTGIYPLRGHQNVQGACDMGALPGVYTGYQLVTKARQKFEKAWGTNLPERQGLTALEMLSAAEAGKLRCMLIIGENPMVSYPDLGRVRKALESLEFLVVCDIFPTETTEMADVVLPAASWAEKDGTFTSAERRIQRVCRAIDPPGEARTEREIACELLTRLGIAASYSSSANVMDEIASLTPIYGGIGYDRLGLEGCMWPCPTRDHPGTEILFSQIFPTTTGRASFWPVEHLDPQETPNEEYPLILTTGRIGHRFHTETMTNRSNLPECNMPRPAVEVNQEDARSLGISDREKVLVETRRGKICIEAKVTTDIPSGIIFVPFHFAEAPANALTSQAADPKSNIPELKVSAARVKKIDSQV
jgi:formate dehydrogenase alpha subunit